MQVKSYFRRGMLVKAREGGEWCGKVPHIQKKMADVFFQFSYNLFMIICSHANFCSFLLLTDTTRKAVEVIYLLISVQVIFFHTL